METGHSVRQNARPHQPNLYECVCGEFALGLDVHLPLLPRRKTDAAYIISKKDRIYVLNPKLHTTVKVVKRANGFEKQYRYHCPSCRKSLSFSP